MKVVFIIDDLNRAGAELTLFRLIAGIDRTRFQPTVISLISKGTLGEQIEKLGIDVHVVGLKGPKSSLVALWRIAAILRRVRPDIVQGWTYYGNLAATSAGILTPGPRSVLWNIRHLAHDLRSESRVMSSIIRISAFLSRRPAKIVYCAESAAARHESLGFNAARRVIIPNGFDLASFAPSEDARASVRAELGLERSRRLVGLVARYHPMKDHFNFLRAAATVAKQIPDVDFLMVGDGIDRSNSTIMKFVTEHGLAHRTHLLGERSDIPRLTSSLDVACCSSWTEAFPNVLGEAMASGVPCVSTDAGDAAEIIGETGRVVPVRDSGAQARAIEEMLRIDPENRRSLGEKARLRIHERFSLAKMIDAYQELYAELGGLKPVPVGAAIHVGRHR